MSPATPNRGTSTTHDHYTPACTQAARIAQQAHAFAEQHLTQQAALCRWAEASHRPHALDAALQRPLE